MARSPHLLPFGLAFAFGLTAPSLASAQSLGTPYQSKVECDMPQDSTFCVGYFKIPDGQVLTVTSISAYIVGTLANTNMSFQPNYENKIGLVGLQIVPNGVGFAGASVSGTYFASPGNRTAFVAEREGGSGDENADMTIVGYLNARAAQ